MARLDVRKLSRLDQVVLAAGAVALVALFLPWYGASAGAFSVSVSGWSTSYGWLGGLLVVAAGVVLLLVRSGRKLPSLPVGPAGLVLGLALLGCLVVILRWITLPSGSAGVGGVAAYSYGPQLGLYIVMIVGIAQAAAAVMLFRASGEALPWAGAQPAVPPPPGAQPAVSYPPAANPPDSEDTTP